MLKRRAVGLSSHEDEELSSSDTLKRESLYINPQTQQQQAWHGADLWSLPRSHDDDVTSGLTQQQGSLMNVLLTSCSADTPGCPRTIFIAALASSSSPCPHQLQLLLETKQMRRR